jgi:hypothetical protein
MKILNNDALACILLDLHQEDKLVDLALSARFIESLTDMDLSIDIIDDLFISIIPRDPIFRTIQKEVEAAVVSRKLAMHVVKHMKTINVLVLAQLLSSQDILHCLEMRDKYTYDAGYLAGVNEVLADLKEQGILEYEEGDLSQLDDEDESSTKEDSMKSKNDKKETLH